MFSETSCVTSLIILCHLTLKQNFGWKCTCHLRLKINFNLGSCVQPNFKLLETLLYTQRSGSNWAQLPDAWIQEYVYEYIS